MRALIAKAIGGAFTKALDWMFGAPDEQISTGVELEADGVPIANPQPTTVVRTVLANGEVWEMELPADPRGVP